MTRLIIKLVYCIHKAWCGTLDDFSGQFFRIFEIIIFCSIVVICDLVHSVEAMYSLP